MARCLLVLNWKILSLIGVLWGGAEWLNAAQQNPDEVAKLARGRVFVDLDGDGKCGPQDSRFAGVRVSNGQDIVRTNERGEYELPVTDDLIIFVIKPSGFRTALSREGLPRFYYIHKPAGSPQLQFAGVKPTGPLPQSIDFPLYPQQEPGAFRVVLFGDPQPRNLQEVDYISEDLVADLMGVRAAFGVSLGDLVFDDLNLFDPLNQTIGLLGIPWYNVIGNHDVNRDATERRWINESFERTYGPSYYSFDYGQVHFVVLDNIDWQPAADGKMGFAPGFGAEQLAFLKKDLQSCPPSQFVVLMMHVPLLSNPDAQQVFRLIEERPLCISISGHLHLHQHQFFTAQDGWRGARPHHHIINVTVSGSWWSGKKDERGIPHATMADGGPNGCSILTFDGAHYQLDYWAAGLDRGKQMRVEYPRQLPQDQLVAQPLYVNVFDGSEKTRVFARVNGQESWRELARVLEPDPFFSHLYQEQAANPIPGEPALTKPAISTHLWKGALPELKPGAYLLEVKAVDHHGRTHSAQRTIRVTDSAQIP